MIPSLHNGITALKSLSQGLQVLGNNIANVNSLGYKSSRANYSDNFYLHMNDAESGPDGEPSNNIQQHGTGVHVSSVSSNFSQGTIEVTGLDLDLAIQGEALPNAGGFFEITDSNTGELFYTRAGAFESDNNGFVVTRDQYRYRLQGVEGEVSVALPDPENQSLLARRVEEDGVINVVLHDKTLQKDIVAPVSQVKVVNFGSPQYLRRVGNGFYSNGRAGQDLARISADNVPASGSNGKLKQYALELSNVDLTNEFAAMISHQRSFQAGSRVVTTSDAILSEAVNLKR
jgi:flagellar hook protein FlgE